MQKPNGEELENQMYNFAYGQPMQVNGQQNQAYGLQPQNNPITYSGGGYNHTMDIESQRRQTYGLNGKQDRIIYPGTKQGNPAPSSYSRGATMVDSSFTSRIQFVRKVYVLLTIQLALTAGICALSILTIDNGGFGHFQMTNQYLLYVAIVLQLVLIIMIFCLKPLARRVPWNYLLLFLFTLVEAYLVSAICAAASKSGSKSWVVISAAMTAAVTIALTIYAMFTKTDFTVKWGMAVSLPFIMIVLSLSIWVFHFGILSSILNAVFAFIYCWFLVYDTQEIMGGKRYALQIDDYVLGVIILYIDIIGLFLSILGSGRRRN